MARFLVQSTALFGSGETVRLLSNAVVSVAKPDGTAAEIYLSEDAATSSGTSLLANDGTSAFEFWLDAAEEYYDITIGREGSEREYRIYTPVARLGTASRAFVSRTDAAAWLETSPPDGRVFYIGELGYETLASATYFDDLPGARPRGRGVSPGHFGGTEGATGEADEAIQSAWDMVKASWNAAEYGFDFDLDFHGQTFRATSELDFTALRQPGLVIRNGTLIVADTAETGTIIGANFCHTNQPRFENFRIFGDRTYPVKVGAYFGRRSDMSIAPNHHFNGLRTDGHFSGAAIVFFASEVKQLTDCLFTNDHRSITAVTVADVDNWQALTDQIGTVTTSTATALPSGTTTGSNVLHDYGSTQFKRPSAYALAITGITKANPAVVSVDAASLVSSEIANGDKVFIDVPDGMTEVDHKVFTVANIDTGAGTFELSGIDSTAYTTFTSGTLRNQTGPAFLMSGMRGLTMDQAYFLTYGSPAIIADVREVPGGEWNINAQFENNPAEVFRFKSGTAGVDRVVQGFKFNVHGWGQAHSTALVSIDGTSVVDIQDLELKLRNAGTAPSAGMFGTPASFKLRRAILQSPLSAALNNPADFALFEGSTVAFDRSPSRVDYSSVFVPNPTVAFETPGDSTITYGTRYIRGERIGRSFPFNLRVDFTTNAYTTPTGRLVIDGLPFSAFQTTPLVVSRHDNAVIAANDVVLVAEVATDGNIYLSRPQTSGARLNAGPTTFPASTTFSLYISGRYEVA